MTRPALIPGHRPGLDQRDPFAGLGLGEATWMAAALCRLPTFKGEPISPDLWHPTSSGPAYSLAHRVCEACPVKRPCLDYALASERDATTWTRHGMYGGLTPDQRADLAKETT